jgi:PST family polysaccharide transporter
MLPQEDFGWLASGLLILTPCYILAGQAISSAIVRASAINQLLLSTLFWLGTALSAALGSIISLGGFAILFSANEMSAALFFVFLGGTLFLRGVGIVHVGILRRNMRFGKIATIELLSQSIGLLSAVVAAGNGFGVIAFGMQLIAVELSRSMMLMGVTGWIPSWSCELRAARTSLHFSMHLLGFEFLNYVRANAADLIVVSALNATALGVFYNAKRILQMPTTQFVSPISSVAISALTRTQESPELYRTKWKKFASLVSFLGIPASFLFLVVARDLVSVLLGPNWANAVPIIHILAPTAYIAAINSSRGWIFQSLGQSDRQLRWGLFTTPITLIAAAFGVRFGLVGVAVASTAISILLQPLAFSYAFREAPVSYKDLCQSILPATLIAAMASIVVGLLIATGVMEIWHAGVRLFISLFLFFTVYLSGIALFPSGREILFEIFTLARSKIVSGLFSKYSRRPPK